MHNSIFDSERNDEFEGRKSKTWYCQKSKCSQIKKNHITSYDMN